MVKIIKEQKTKIPAMPKLKTSRVPKLPELLRSAKSRSSSSKPAGGGKKGY